FYISILLFIIIVTLLLVYFCEVSKLYSLYCFRLDKINTIGFATHHSDSFSSLSGVRRGYHAPFRLLFILVWGAAEAPSTIQASFRPWLERGGATTHHSGYFSSSSRARSTGSPLTISFIQ